MKTKLLLLIVAGAFACSSISCKSTKTDPVTGQQYEAYDPVKTAEVKAAVEPLVTSGVRRAIRKSEDAEKYARGVGRVFCKMKEQKQFSPDFLIDEVNLLANDKIKDDTLIDAKNAVIALYKIFYTKRHSAELPEDKWLYHVSDVFCATINQALIDLGKPGV